MRSPSPRVLINVVNVLPFVPAQDAEAGIDPAGCYPAAAISGVRCTAQCSSSVDVDEMGRASTVNDWTVIFAPADLAGVTLDRNDRLDLLAADGSVLQSLYVNGSLDGAGRGSNTAVTCRDVL